MFSVSVINKAIRWAMPIHLTRIFQKLIQDIIEDIPECGKRIFVSIRNSTGGCSAYTDEDLSTREKLVSSFIPCQHGKHRLQDRVCLKIHPSSGKSAWKRHTESWKTTGRQIKIISRCVVWFVHTHLQIRVTSFLRFFIPIQESLVVCFLFCSKLFSIYTVVSACRKKRLCTSFQLAGLD